jgi:putative NADPH-quinone reductase
MSHSICLIDGHPHAEPSHFCHALADAYAAGAREAHHALTRFNLAELDLPNLRDPRDFATPAPDAVRSVQDAVLTADHVGVVYPLWLGTMPALVKGFFEHFARAEFAISASEKGWPRKMLKGRSARVIVTMGMPATAYKLMFGAHGVRGFESGILGIAGFNPIHETLIGGVEISNDERLKWIGRVEELGRRGE